MGAGDLAGGGPLLVDATDDDGVDRVTPAEGASAAATAAAAAAAPGRADMPGATTAGKDGLSSALFAEGESEKSASMSMGSPERPACGGSRAVRLTAGARAAARSGDGVTASSISAGVRAAAAAVTAADTAPDDGGELLPAAAASTSGSPVLFVSWPIGWPERKYPARALGADVAGAPLEAARCACSHAVSSAVACTTVQRSKRWSSCLTTLKTGTVGASFTWLCPATCMHACGGHACRTMRLKRAEQRTRFLAIAGVRVQRSVKVVEATPGRRG